MPNDLYDTTGKVQVSFFMRPADKQRLRTLAAREQMPVAVLIRRLILREVNRKVPETEHIEATG